MFDKLREQYRKEKQELLLRALCHRPKCFGKSQTKMCSYCKYRSECAGDQKK